jgi:hypothetical protein
MGKFRAAVLYSIAILITVVTSMGYIRSAGVFWFCIGLIVVLAGVATCTLEPVSSRIFRHRPPVGTSTAARQLLIERSRAMVTDVHNKARATRNKKTVKEHLEAHRDFPAVRQYLSERSKDAIWGRIAVVAPESTMDGTLHSILEDIDRLEQEWGLK